MKKFFLILLGLVILVIGGALALPFVIPTDTYKEQITAQVAKATGRTLTIGGPLEFSVWPTLGVRLTDVQFANVPGSEHPDMVALESLEAELKVWPLVRGEVEVDRFVLIEPVVHLEVDADGRPNWAFGGIEAEGADSPPAGAGTSGSGADDGPAPPTGDGQLPITDVRLGDIRIEGGVVTYSDAVSGASERLEAVNLSLSLPDLRRQLEANGSLDYKGGTITLDLTLAEPLGLIQGSGSPLRMAIATDPARVDFDGILSRGPDVGAIGRVDLDVSSIRALAAWLAAPLAFEGEGLRTLAISGALDASPTRIGFNDAELKLDDVAGTGQVLVYLNGAVPRLSGRLDLATVDLNPYLPPAAAPAANRPADAGNGDQGQRQAGGTSAGNDGGARPADGNGGGGGWSDEPLAIPPLDVAEVDFQLTLAGLRVQELQLDRTALDLRLAGSALTLDLTELALYGGTGRGRIDLSTADGTPTLSKQFRLEGLQALPFLTDAAAFEQLEGTANAELAFTTRGASERQLVQNLNGDGQVSFTDGAIVGINLAAMVRNVTSAFLGAEAGTPQRTDFAELSGSFTVADGILVNDDMRLRAPVLRVNGAGRVDLPSRTVDYRVEPKAAATLEGQGGDEEVAGLLVPVVIRGPWDDLVYQPDVGAALQSALENPEALEQQLEQLGEQADQLKDAIKKGDADDLIKGLGGALGGGSAESSPDDGEAGGAPPADAAQKLLKGLFGND